jgi:hypothetical protein
VGDAGGGFSIVRQDAAEIRRIHDELVRRDAEMQRRLGGNLQTWDDELARLAAWADLDDETRRGLWGVSGTTVLMFPCDGGGPSDDAAARHDLAAGGSPVHTIVWGTGETVLAASASWREVLGDEATDRLVGQPPAGMMATLSEALGPLSQYRIISEQTDRVDAVASFERLDARVAMVPMRDRDGHAATAHQLFAFTPRDGG